MLSQLFEWLTLCDKLFKEIHCEKTAYSDIAKA